jgi:RNA polymerase sigma-B factor
MSADTLAMPAAAPTPVVDHVRADQQAPPTLVTQRVDEPLLDEIAEDEADSRQPVFGTLAERHAMVEQHIALADHIARRLCPPTVSREDFIQVARLALVQAAERFDPDRGVPFAGYAGVVVSGRLKHYLRDSCWDVRVPRSLQETWLRAGKARDTLSQRLGRSPSIAELATELGVDEEHLLASIPVGDSWTVTRFEGLAPREKARGSRPTGATRTPLSTTGSGCARPSPRCLTGSATSCACTTSRRCRSASSPSASA